MEHPNIRKTHPKIWRMDTKFAQKKDQNVRGYPNPPPKADYM